MKNLLKIGLVIAALCLSSLLGISQHVFNIAFDTFSISNISRNVIEIENGYLFTYGIKYGVRSKIQVVRIYLDGQIMGSSTLFNTNSILDAGNPGSLQKINEKEYCQLFGETNMNRLRLIYFNENLVVKRNVKYNFNKRVEPIALNISNDSTVLILGKVGPIVERDLVLVNSDLQGNERWRTFFGDSIGFEYGNTVLQVDSQIVVGGQTGYQNPQIFTFNLNGQQTSHTIFQNYDNGGSLAYHKDFGLYMLCSKEVAGGFQPILVRLRKDLSIDWSKVYFKDGTDSYLSNFTINDDGRITMVGGNFNSTSNDINGLFFQVNHLGDSLGFKLHNHIDGYRAQFYDIRQTIDGGYVLAGTTSVPTQDSWIVKVNAWGCDNIPCIVGVNEIDAAEGILNCYPNPTNGMGTIAGSITKLTGRTEIKIFNTLGQLISTIPITQKDFEVEVNLTKKGLYLVNLYQDNQVLESVKWVVR